MKLSEYKEFIRERLGLLKANTLFSFQKDTAYWADNWGSVLSTTFYTLSMLVFINVLYSNVQIIVGYTKNDMLLFFLMGQIAFYTTWAISAQNMQEFVQDVNRGDLDLILTKPFPALFYITFKRVRLFSNLFRDGIPPSLAIVIAIDWSQFHFSLVTVGVAAVLVLCGQICMHVLQFISVIPVIWLGESRSIFKLFFDIDTYAGKLIPLEGFNGYFRMVFGVLIPVMISASFPTSVLLNKSDPILLLVWAIIVTSAALYIRNWVWQIAIRNYTSASS
jgi:ABC-type uncharacterized transport system permease subunit